jgi:hypothetical protein
VPLDVKEGEAVKGPDFEMGLQVLPGAAQLDK